MKNYYFDDTNESKPYTHELDANDDTMPPDNALRIAPKFKDGHHPCAKNGKWVLVEDNRDATVYDTETKEEVKIDYLGKIKDGFTPLKPFEFSIWNGTEWILNIDEKNEFTIQQNQSIRDSLLAEATNEIEILNDKVELEKATDEDNALLKKWKLYRIDLKELDISQLDVTFPAKP